MKELIEINGVRVLAVKVPTGGHSTYDSHGFYIDENNLMFKIGGSRHEYSRTLPEGDWVFHSISTDLTDEQLEVILPSTHKYRRFSHLMEILRSHGIDLTAKYVILIERKDNGR